MDEKELEDGLSVGPMADDVMDPKKCYSGEPWILGLPRPMSVLSWNCRGLVNPQIV